MMFQVEAMRAGPGQGEGGTKKGPHVEGLVARRMTKLARRPAPEVDVHVEREVGDGTGPKTTTGF